MKHFNGLTEREVAESRAAHGSNLLTPPEKTPAWRKYIAKLKDPLIVILMVAGVLSLLIACYEYYATAAGASAFFEPIGIFLAIIFATGLAFYFEQKADKEFEILNRVNDDEPVQVIRNGGNVTEIPKKDVVVGDVVVLNTGNDIPADGILLESVTLSVDESTLTGEPMASKTTDEAHFDPEATFPSNMVMRGTRVIEGHGVMEVTAVGDATENGKVYTAAQIDNSVRTPLNEQLDRLGALISRVSYTLAILIVVGRVGMYLAYVDFEWLSFISRLLQSLMVAVALVVVSVPEGLPMAVTLSLAYSMRRMLKSNNLVRKMHACETMGATTVICTDKTGTLTENQMRIYSTDFFVPESDFGYIYQGIAVNTTAVLDRSGDTPKVLGNPTEGALLLWLDGLGKDYGDMRAAVTVEEELPFSTERKYMATVVRDADGRRILYVKGAPEIIFGLCSRYPAGVTREGVDALLAGYQAKAMRTLGFAYQVLADGDPTIADKKVVATGLTFIGIVAISDPVRATVPAAVKEVLDAGIGIKIVTGDTPGTATEIARQIGLWKDGDDASEAIITGEEFAAIPDEELPARVGALKVIARARPMDKKRLVEALQHNGEVVAVTGDGTNDAPALKAAHVGLSMGDGTSVAKEASDITIVDNSFTSIGRAVMWGRSLYLNIQRFIMFQMTVNVVASLIVFVGSFMGMQSPLTVTQMLWVNLIMDTFAAMALASLPPSEAVMHDKPRSRKAFIITRAMWTDIIGTGVLFFAILVGLLYYLEHTDLTSLTQIGRLPLLADNKGMSAYELSIFFTTFVFMNFWNMFNARAYATGRSALHLRNCGEFILTIMLIVVGQIVIVTAGGRFFSVTPLKITDWLIIIGSTSVVLWIGELYRLFRSRK